MIIAAMLDATEGPEPGSPYVAPGPTGFLAALNDDPHQLHVGISTATEVFGMPMEGPCVEAVHATGRLLQDLGHIVEEVPLPRQALLRTMVANLTGIPAMSVPLHRTEDDLPIGVQFLGRFGDEATLLRLAAQLEQAKPWRVRH